MNPIIVFLLFWFLLGLLDSIRGNRWGLARFVDTGLSSAGSFVAPYIGICCMGSLLMDTAADGIAALTLVEPASILGSLLAPDLGGLPLSVQIAPEYTAGVFCGAVLTACMGQFISFQLPVLSSALTDSPGILIQGYIAGLVCVPLGIAVGGAVLGVPLAGFLKYSAPILLVCAAIAIGFVFHPAATQSVLQAVGKALQKLCVVFFAATVLLLFAGHPYVLTVLADSMLAYVKMVAVIIGGCVFSGIAAKWIQKASTRLDPTALTGIVLSCVNSMAMAPLWQEMDPRGKRVNAAFSVSGAYMLGGQLSMVADLGDSRVVCAFLLSKLSAGILSICVALALSRRGAAVK